MPDAGRDWDSHSRGHGPGSKRWCGGFPINIYKCTRRGGGPETSRCGNLSCATDCGRSRPGQWGAGAHLGVQPRPGRGKPAALSVLLLASGPVDVQSQKEKSEGLPAGAFPQRTSASHLRGLRVISGAQRGCRPEKSRSQVSLSGRSTGVGGRNWHACPLSSVLLTWGGPKRPPAERCERARGANRV